jgi:hypothetical protein
MNSELPIDHGIENMQHEEAAADEERHDEQRRAGLFSSSTMGCSSVYAKPVLTVSEYSARTDTHIAPELLYQRALGAQRVGSAAVMPPMSAHVLLLLSSSTASSCRGSWVSAAAASMLS